MVRWQGPLGIAIAFFFALPYVMGSEVEKYLRAWVEAANQQQGQTQFELKNYQRHWFNSEGDLLLTNLPVNKQLTLHFTAYHGPLILHAGPKQHLGLGYIEASLDRRDLVSEQSALQLSGPLLFSAYLPYFSDPKLQGRLPALTLRDQGNKLLYQVPTANINFADDGLLQLDIPTLKVSRPDGSEKLTLNNGLLRILPDSNLASFSANEIRITLNNENPLLLQHFLLKANLDTHPETEDKRALTVNAHFDQLQAAAGSWGPFNLQLHLNGLQRKGLHFLMSVLKTLDPQKADLTPEQNEALEKSVSNLFAADAFFDLQGDLDTAKGKIKSQFHGGFKAERAKSPWHNTLELVDAFYSKGSVFMSPETKQLLSQAYLAYPPSDQAMLIALPLLLSSLKLKGQEYSAHLDIRDGSFILYGKK